MKFIKILLLPAMLIVAGSAFAQTTPEQRIAHIIDALNTKNSEALINQLDDSCKIANLPRGHNQQIVPVILRNYGAIASYKIVKQEKNANQLKVFLDVIYQTGAPGHPWFLLNDTKVLEMHIIKDVALTKEDDLGKATLGGILPGQMTVNFHLYNNLVYVDAKVNGMKGLFQLDSGSPVILLNKSCFPGAQNSPDVTNAVNLTGFNGKMNNVTLTEIASLKWGTMQLHNFKAASVTAAGGDNHIAGLNVFGLLGYEVFKDYEITFDYTRQLLTLVKVNANGDATTTLANPLKPKAEMAMVMQRHLPIIPVQIGHKTYQLGIDCGANANVIYTKYYPEIATLLGQPEQQELITAGNTSSETQTYILKTATINKYIFKDMLTILSADNMYMPRPQNKLQIDGLLGAPFLSQHTIGINFKKQLVKFY